MPGLYLCGFLTPPVAGADLRAAFVASCFLGALPPVDFLAVCFVLAIVSLLFDLYSTPIYDDQEMMISGVKASYRRHHSHFEFIY